MNADYVSVTEVADDEVTREQVDRLAHRYYWAAPYCSGRRVLEVACGTGQGVGYLGTIARTIVAGDISEPLLLSAKRHYGDRFAFLRLNGQELPFPAQEFDVVVIFEALYYIADVGAFFRECRRVLAPNGFLLIASANKDLYDFNPSPFSQRYLGVSELHQELSREGFAVKCYGGTKVAAASMRQRLLRPVKAAAARLGLIPKSMRGKKLLKRLVFGKLVVMPAEIAGETATREEPAEIPDAGPDRAHKVIYCAAQLLS